MCVWIVAVFLLREFLSVRESGEGWVIDMLFLLCEFLSVRESGEGWVIDSHSVSQSVHLPFPCRPREYVCSRTASMTRLKLSSRTAGRTTSSVSDILMIYGLDWTKLLQSTYISHSSCASQVSRSISACIDKSFSKAWRNDGILRSSAI